MEERYGATDRKTQWQTVCLVRSGIWSCSSVMGEWRVYCDGFWGSDPMSTPGFAEFISKTRSFSVVHQTVHVMMSSPEPFAWSLNSLYQRIMPMSVFMLGMLADLIQKSIKKLLIVATNCLRDLPGMAGSRLKKIKETVLWVNCCVCMFLCI